MNPAGIRWLASYPKSGNTWARLLLAAYHHDGHLHINDTPSVGDVGEHFYQAATARQIGSLSGMEKALLRPAALLNLMAMTRYRPLVVKTHFANIELHGQRMIPPELTFRAIYVVRDPRDLAPSAARHFGRTLDETIADLRDETRCIGPAKRVPHIVSSWSNHVRSWSAGDPETTLVRYEDMVADTCDALERMLVTVNITPDAERIERAVEACRMERVKKSEAAIGFREASAKAGEFFGATTETLSESQRLEVENDHGEMMEAVGY